jgi:hypothetical protein
LNDDLIAVGNVLNAARKRPNASIRATRQKEGRRIGFADAQ